MVGIDVTPGWKTYRCVQGTRSAACVAAVIVEADVIIGFGHFDLAIPEHCLKLYREGCAGRIIFTGGVALIRGMAQAIESEIGHPVSIATNPQFTGALGAALLACEFA